MDTGEVNHMGVDMTSFDDSVDGVERSYTVSKKPRGKYILR